MTLLTVTQLASATGSSLLRASARLDTYNRALPLYDITSRLRLACFFANVGHETLGFQFSTEIWAPTAAQNGYEGRHDLGNTKPGDGKRFLARGDLGTTGRANYAALRDRLRKRFPLLQVPDFELYPEQLAEPLWAPFGACDYWAMRGINQYADAGNFEACCDLVNRGHFTITQGDANGFQNRLALFVAGMRFLP